MNAPPPNARPSIWAKVFPVLLSLMLTAGGFFLLFYATPRLIEGLSARSWPEAPVRLISTEVVEVDLGGQGPGTKRWFAVQLAYEFEAGGRTYRGHRIGLWNERWLRPKAKEMAIAYASDPALKVYFNPSDPTHSLLDRSVEGGTWLMVCAGIPVFVLGMMMPVGLVRAVRLGPVDASTRIL